MVILSSLHFANHARLVCRGQRLRKGSFPVSFAFDCVLASYLLLASLTIWCAQARVTAFPVETPALPGASDAPDPTRMLRIVEPAVASIPHALGSLACMVAALALVMGTPFDPRYAAVGALAVSLYLMLLNLSHLIEDWDAGVTLAETACVRSLLPTLLGLPMLVAGLRLL